MRSVKIITALWLLWAAIVIAFQALATARLDPVYPDRAQEWTTRFTGVGYQINHVYLLEPFMNQQVAWDSEYYLSIAIGGYDDPKSPHLTPQGTITVDSDNQVSRSDWSFNHSVSVNYAFFPFYPLMIRTFAIPLQVLGLNPIATATLAGVIVSALGALLGMLALFDLARDVLGEDGAFRASFYLIIFPTAFFLIQVYTEGLFVGLSFACLAMAKRNDWLAAAFFGVAATMTRAVGVVLLIPMIIAWIRTDEWMHLEWGKVFNQGNSKRILNGLLTLSPLIAFVIWRFSFLGLAFHYVESNYFRRGFLSLGFASSAWFDSFLSMLTGNNPQHTAYYLTEFLGFFIAVISCITILKSHPEIGWYSLAVFIISWGSGPAQGIHRYILAAPAVFIALAQWGRNPVFERAWTILSLLLMGLLSMLFAFDMWVA